MVTSLGSDREETWQSVRSGQSGVRLLADDHCAAGIVPIGAVVDSDRIERPCREQLKTMTLGLQAAREAVNDACIDFSKVQRDRFACAVSGHMGDYSWIRQRLGDSLVPRLADSVIARQWLPNSTCATIAYEHGLLGPRICHSTACASGLIDFMCAVRAIRDDQCDLALAGSAESIDPLFAAGFQQMRVLAENEHPHRACRPFDRSRNGFVMGEGAAMFVVERLSHALARGARIYAEVLAGKMLSDAHHVTGLDTESDSLTFLIRRTLRTGKLVPRDVGYINAHGTGTVQNDLLEIRGIREALGRYADDVCVSASKSMLGHLVNAAGTVELAITVLAMRDGFAPPTLNLINPDPECNLDCVPLEGRTTHFQHALKLSIAFGGHLVAVLLRRWNDPLTGYAYPTMRRAA